MWKGKEIGENGPGNCLNGSCCSKQQMYPSRSSKSCGSSSSQTFDFLLLLQHFGLQILQQLPYKSKAFWCLPKSCQWLVDPHMPCRFWFCTQCISSQTQSSVLASASCFTTNQAFASTFLQVQIRNAGLILKTTRFTTLDSLQDGKGNFANSELYRCQSLREGHGRQTLTSRHKV